MMRRAKSITSVAVALVCLLGANAQAQEEAGAGAVLPDSIEPWQNDKDVHMIAIEALVVEVNEDKTRELGIRYSFVRNDVSKVVEGADLIFGPRFTPVLVPTLSPVVTAGLPLSGDATLGFTPRLPGLGFTLSGMDINGGVFSARLRALLDRGEARISNRPIVLTLNGKNATFNIGSEVPYQDTTVSGNRENLDVKFEKVGVNVDVSPSILSLQSQVVQLDVKKIEVSSVSNFIRERNVERPVFNKAETRTKISLRSGDTYLMSSLKGRRKIVFREGIPFLMHIPFFGHFFSSREEQIQSVDILFFVTPHIVPPGRNILLPWDFLNQESLVEDHDVILRN